jgi:16S rRNA (guanine527-N7)-methyltransferase
VTPLEALSKGAAAILERPLSAQERDDFSKYLSLLLKWQKAHRLVGSSDPMWIVEHLFLDSLLFLRLLPSSVRTLADLGSGAGLPGLPVKIVRREIEIVLIESRRRRAMFLASAIRAMKLGGARVVEGRVENLGDELHGRLDAVIMRCAGDVAAMLPAAAALVSEPGIVIASGPPKPKPLSFGEWATVPGVKPGSTRRFAVYRRPGLQSPRSPTEH